MKIIYLLISICFVTLLSCTNQKKEQKIADTRQSIDYHNHEIKVLDDSIAVHDLKLDSLKRILNDIKAESKADSLNMMIYLLDHKMATLAILGGVISSDAASNFKNKYSADEQLFGDFGTAAALIWSIGHLGEVIEVLAEFGKFDARGKNRDIVLEQVNGLIVQELQKAEQARQERTNLSNQVDSLSQDLQLLQN